jgi:hypothetical protein
MIKLENIHSNDPDVEFLAQALLSNKVARHDGVVDSLEVFKYRKLTMSVMYHRPHTTVILEEEAPGPIVVHSICAHWPDQYDKLVGRAIATRSLLKKYLSGICI